MKAMLNPSYHIILLEKTTDILILIRKANSNNISDIRRK